MFLTFSYFTFYGMMAVGLTSSQQLAAVISSAFYSIWNLFSGFLIPRPVSWLLPRLTLSSSLLAPEMRNFCSSSFCWENPYKTWLISGFFVMQSMPPWWFWYYYLSPVAWTLYGLIESQLGDVKTPINAAGFPGLSVEEYLHEYFGYSHSMVGVCAAVLVGFVLLFWLVFAFSIKFLNFQRR